MNIKDMFTIKLIDLNDILLRMTASGIMLVLYNTLAQLVLLIREEDDKLPGT